MSTCTRNCATLLYITCAIVTSGLAQSTNWPPPGATEKKFYVETSFQVNWYGAYASCMKNNSRLARVETEQENWTVLRLIRSTGIKKRFYWIGGSDLADEGRWTWLLSGQPLAGFTFWHDGEPNNDHSFEHCLLYAPSLLSSFLESDPAYKWNDAYCANQNYFLCEYYDKRPGLDDCDWRG